MGVDCTFNSCIISGKNQSHHLGYMYFSPQLSFVSRMPIWAIFMACDTAA